MGSERSRMIFRSHSGSYVNSGAINHDITSNYCTFILNGKGVDDQRKFLSPLVNLKQHVVIHSTQNIFTVILARQFALVCVSTCTPSERETGRARARGRLGGRETERGR